MAIGQLIGRYLGYYVSILPLMLGIIWVAFDPRKQGFLDKLGEWSRTQAIVFARDRGFAGEQP